MAEKQEGSDTKSSTGKTAPSKGPGIRTFNVYIGDECYEVDVEETSAASAARPVVSAPPKVAQPAPSAAPASAPAPAPAAAPAPVSAGEGEAVVTVPMPGTVLKYEVNVGDTVKKGDIVAVLEAMKMENAIPSPADGVVKTISSSPGTSLKKGDALAVITKG